MAESCLTALTISIVSSIDGVDVASVQSFDIMISILLHKFKYHRNENSAGVNL